MKKGVLKYFTKFTGKGLCQSLRLATLLNKWLWHRCFTASLAKFLRTLFCTEDLWTTASEFNSEMLIFSSSRTQMFSKISVLKNFAILEPLSNNNVADLLLQNTYVGSVWVFVAGNLFLQLIMVFIADSRTGFCCGFLRKHILNLRSNHWSCSVKRMFLEHLQISQENDCVKAPFEQSFRPFTDVFLWNSRNF